MKKILLLLTITLVISIGASSQTDEFKALFIFNFTKYLEWPSYLKQRDFVIGVFGISGISKELEIIAQKQKIGNQKIVVKTFLALDKIVECQILYITPAKSKLINEVISKIGNSSTLLISDKEGMALKGAGINYITTGDRIDYEMNVANIQKRGLKINHSLLLLGKTVSN
jgi:hypothetical protein